LRSAGSSVDKTQLSEHLRFYQELGVDGVNRDPAWRKRASNQSVPEEDHPLPADDASPESAPLTFATSSAEVLKDLRSDIGDCTRCKLHRLGRRQIVCGAGTPTADLMFAGEAPGADEDIQGDPFVGRAGQLLTKIIEAIGLSRSDVYIANVIKCRPPENRNPEPDEVDPCEP